jgi:hypothetical protein
MLCNNAIPLVSQLVGLLDSMLFGTLTVQPVKPLGLKKLVNLQHDTMTTCNMQ